MPVTIREYSMKQQMLAGFERHMKTTRQGDAPWQFSRGRGVDRAKGSSGSAALTRTVINWKKVFGFDHDLKQEHGNPSVPAVRREKMGCWSRLREWWSR